MIEDAFVTVDGSHMRTPWHIVSFIWLMLCLLCRVYCGRLKTLGRDERVKELISEMKAEDGRDKKACIEKVWASWLWIKEKAVAGVGMVVMGAVFVGMKILELCGEKREDKVTESQRQSAESIGYHDVRLGDYDEYEDYDVDGDHLEDHSLVKENSEEQTLQET